MRIRISFQEIAARYPAAVQLIAAKLKAGRSKHKNDPLDSFEWGFDWTQVIHPRSMVEMIAEVERAAGETPKYLQDLDIEAEVEKIKADLSATIYVTKGNCFLRTNALSEIPIEILNRYRTQYEAEQRERVRYRSLTDEEHNKELHDVLQELGFLGYIGPPALGKTFPDTAK